MLTIGTTSVFLILDNRKKSEIIKNQANIIIRQNNRIKELKDLCENKDEYVCRLMSKLLRKGISEGGTLMADRKKWLKQKINAI